MWLRRFAARKRKRGASLVMVLVSMTILTIMGTLFTTIAMRSYQYSYSRMCRQQAYYTATSSVESLYAKIKTNGSILNDITKALNDAYVHLKGEELGIDVTTVRVKIGSTGGGEAAAEGVVGSDFFYTYLGECDLWARYNNAKRTEISLEAEATYNGYSETARAIIAKTNGAASELKKIFDNTFCLQSPISTIVAETTHGDIYVSQPIADTDSAAVQNLVKKQTISATDIKAYNTVFAALSTSGTSELNKDGIGIGYDGVPGQYLRDDDGNIITSGDEGKYNKVLRYGVYGNAQASTADGTLTGHTKPLDMDNSPLTAVNIDQPKGSQKPEEDDLWYNDWVELYMFSAADGGTAVNGDLYADSKILIGLMDRNNSNRNYRRLWKDSVKRNVFSAVEKANWTNYYLMDPEFNLLDTNANFEHGFNKDVFFDHDATILTRSVSKFRLNGDMYLWEDARIENFDSYNTANSRENDIFAAKDLYIDGFYIISWDLGKIDETATEVNVGGDVVVKGNAFISNAEIHGDVYCYGDELTIVNSIIHGNVYFTGSDFTSDTTVYEGNVVINHDGSNTNVTNYSTRDDYDKDNLPDNMTEYAWNNNLFGTTHDVGNNTVYSWGATITNCDIKGTLWSNVNTHLLISKWDEGSNSIPNCYGDIYVSKYLFIDLIWTYYCDHGDDRVINTYYQMDTDTTVVSPEVSGHRENWLAYKNDSGNEKDRVNDHYAEAAVWNCFESYASNNVIYADRFQFRTNQGDPPLLTTSIDISYLGKLIVGDGGLYIDGNEWHLRDVDDPTTGWSWSGSRNSICIDKLITASYEQGDSGWPFYKPTYDLPQVWDTEINDTIYVKGSATERDNQLAGYVKSGYSSLSAALEWQKTTALSAFSHSNAVEYESVAFKDNAVWKDKLIKIRTWSAPVAGNKTEFNLVEGLIVKYVGEDVPNQGGGGNTLFGNPTTTTVANYIATYSDAFEVTDNGNTLIISDSVTFNCFADFSDYKRVIFDTSEGNIYVKFLYGAKFGNADAKDYDAGAEVVLTGGSMVFWYLYESGSYDFDKPTLQVNPYTRLGLVSAETGSGYGNDGLYIISNDDSLITMGQNAVLNGYVYTPYGAVYVAPAESSYTALNGCMAIESLILLNTADELPQGSIFDQIKKDWENLIGGGNVTENVDSLVKQYENIIFNYVQPPLITDSVQMGGLTDQEVADFGKVVWEFLGYY